MYWSEGQAVMNAQIRSVVVVGAVNWYWLAPQTV